MKLEIITIPFDSQQGSFSKDLLRKATNNKKIKNYKAELIQDAGKYYWSILLEYENLEGAELLAKEKDSFTEAEQALLEELKAWRKETATEKGVPFYVVAKNEQLKQIVKANPKNIAELQNIHGIGEKKTTEYGAEILKIVKSFSEPREEKK